MKKFTKVLAIALAAALLVGISVGLTVAYLTAEADDKLNTFTVGDITIDLTEEVATEGAATVVETANGAQFANVMPGDKLTKKVTVKNTDDTNAAYVAVTVTLNNAGQLNDAIDDYYEPLGYDAEQIQAIYDEVFPGWGIRYDKYDAQGKHLGMRLTNQKQTDSTLLHVDSAKTTTDGNNYLYSYSNWFQTADEKANSALETPAYGFKDWTKGYYYPGNTTLEIDPMGDYELRYTYFLYLEAGEEYVVFEGLNVPAEFNREQLKMFEGLNIKVEAAAIQAANTADAQAAFASLYGAQ